MKRTGFSIEKRVAISMFNNKLLKFQGACSNYHVLALAVPQKLAGQFHGPCLYCISEVLIIGPIQLKRIVFPGDPDDPMRPLKMDINFSARASSAAEFQISSFSESEEGRLNSCAALSGFHLIG
jgi:hypothetical protein